MKADLTETVAWHAIGADEALNRIQSTTQGLSVQEAALRRREHGENRLPEAKADSLALLFLRQFLSPLIYILLAAAAFSLWMQESSDAIFIFAVLLINAAIGTFQEYAAEKAAHALKQLVAVHATALRDGVKQSIEAYELVPGDMVLLSSGDKVPADIRLVETGGLLVDESLLTGESDSVAKDAGQTLPEGAPLAERINMAFAGSLVAKGRATGVVIATGPASEIGRIAGNVAEGEEVKPPLLSRIDQLTLRLALVMLAVIALLFIITLARGHSWLEMVPIAIALAVAAVPEGMPAAITVALAIGMRRMAKRHVIIRNMAAVETLGSCTYIASDKTGTLTLNDITVEQIALPDGMTFTLKGDRITADNASEQHHTSLRALSRAGVLANEASAVHHEGQWRHEGDKVDISLLVFGHKWGVSREKALDSYPQCTVIPYESENGFSAAVCGQEQDMGIFVKGSVEKLLPMCARMQGRAGDERLDIAAIERQVEALASAGYRVLAFAEGRVTPDTDMSDPHGLLHDLIFLGLAGMIDPLRPEARDAVRDCHDAGIKVAMITGDHPVTALAIARQLGLADAHTQAITGQMLRDAKDEALQKLIRESTIFARIEPQQKQLIVTQLIEAGHYVAVTGDGVNDAPALKAAHVGVAMGKRGSDVARESADIILADDNFASIVEGVREGRIVYANIRKVIFHFISIGVAEILLFLLTIMVGLPMPLTTVQLLWLNLVTGGLQDLPLTLEKAEGDELKKKPRPVGEPVFNRIMIERIALNGIFIACFAFGVFWWLLQQGYDVESARNIILLLMVLFENVQAFNSRSETLSLFRQPFFTNPLLLVGIFLAQGIHIAAMHIPLTQDILAIQPISLVSGGWLLLAALTLLALNEGYKAWYRRTYG